MPSRRKGYYRDSFDHARFRNAVTAARGCVIADGVFLQRPELAELWDFTIFLAVGEEELLRRAARRDAQRLGDVVGRYRRRYLPAQRAYAERVRPAERADAVVDNADPARPVVRL